MDPACDCSLAVVERCLQLAKRYLPRWAAVSTPCISHVSGDPSSAAGSKACMSAGTNRPSAPCSGLTHGAAALRQGLAHLVSTITCLVQACCNCYAALCKWSACPCRPAEVPQVPARSGRQTSRHAFGRLPAVSAVAHALVPLLYAPWPYLRRHVNYSMAIRQAIGTNSQGTAVRAHRASRWA
jgi:hypothetical protein